MIEIPEHIKDIETSPIIRVKEWRSLIPSDIGDIIDLGQAVPNYPPPGGMQEIISNHALQGPVYYYGPGQGVTETRLRVAEFFRDRYDAKVTENEILMTAGANNAFYQVVMTLFSRGDSVLLPVPYYFNHYMTLKACRCFPILVPAGEKDGFFPDIGELEKRVGKNTKALVLVTPNNPTGAVAGADYLIELYKFIKKHSLFLIIDETYQDFTQSPGVPSLLLRQIDWKDHLIHIYTFSKSLSLCGMRSGTITADPVIINEILKIHDCNIICAPIISQYAVSYAVKNELFWLDERVKEMQIRLRDFLNAFESVKDHFRIVSSGAFFAYMKHDFGKSSWDIARLLACKSGILCIPGEAFGHDQRDYLRFALGNICFEDYSKLIERIKGFTV